MIETEERCVSAQTFIVFKIIEDGSLGFQCNECSWMFYFFNISSHLSFFFKKKNSLTLPVLKLKRTNCSREI